MKKKPRREVNTISMSFLDAITCGFGSIILLIVITKTNQAVPLEDTDSPLDGIIAEYQEELRAILGETDRIRRSQAETEEEIALDQSQIAALEAELTRIRAAYQNEQTEAEIAADIAGQLAVAKQSMSDEMERLLGLNRPRPEDAKIGGIPVDSEYVIFLIDSSPSMKRYEWDRVMITLRETLEIYPTVKGMQVLNDEGNHLLLSSRGEWIQDTPTMRQYILENLENWDAYSTSNPRRGILAALDRYTSDPDKKVSLYVYSDDFSAGAGAINSVVREVDARNRRDANGERRVRIHAVAFPVYWDYNGGNMLTGGDYAVLMRTICMRNGGTFVALPSRQFAL